MPGCYFRRLIGVGICPAFPEGAAAGFRRQSGFSKGRVKMAEQSVKTGGDPVHFLDIRREFPAPVFPVEPAGRSGWRNGMAVRMPNHLGDAVMALPALMQLRRLVPEQCGLYVIAPAGQRPLYTSLPFVDGQIALERVHRCWSRKEWTALRRMRFGVGVLFNNSFRDALLMRLAGIPELYGAAARCRSPLLRRAFRFPPRPVREPARLHHANKYLSMAAALGAPAWDGTLPEFRLEPPVDELSPEIGAICQHPRLMTIASGAAYGAAKRWESGSFREVARHWIGQGGIVAVLGSASEAGIGDEVIEGLDPRRAFNLSGRTNLADLMNLLKSSVLTVANDSGIMHLAAALGRPGVAIFGPTDYTATGPIGNSWRLLYNRVECSPCFRRECPDGSRRCMAAVTPEMVIREVDAIASGSGR